MGKKVTIGAKPTKRPAPPVTPDEWVARGSSLAPSAESPERARKPDREPTTRYTIDIPTRLHAQIKIKCAQQGVKMNEEIIRLFEKHFSED